MTIEDILIEYNMLSDTITLEFGKDNDNMITVLVNDEEILLLPTNLDCYKYDLGYRLEDNEITDFKLVMKLIKKLTEQMLKHNAKYNI